MPPELATPKFEIEPFPDNVAYKPLAWGSQTGLWERFRRWLLTDRCVQCGRICHRAYREPHVCDPCRKVREFEEKEPLRIKQQFASYRVGAAYGISDCHLQC